jgi:negative regulator of genetic competence, sporulation and motility
LNIESTSKNTIIISLSNDDLQSLGITYEDMDYNTIETRRVIYTLLEEANKTLDKDIHPSGKMFIEAIPDPFGGCVLYFTVFQNDADKEEEKPTQMSFFNYLCEFKNENNLIDASRAVLTSFRNPPNSRLYSNGNNYRMVFKVVEDRPKFKAIICEYSDKIFESNLKIIQTTEHWDCICDENAVEKIGSK